MPGSEKLNRKRRRASIRDQASPDEASPDRDVAPGLPDLLRDNAGPLLSVLFVSLALRLIVWFWVTSVPVQLLYDENMYLARSLGAAEVVSALGSGQLPSESVQDSWFGNGIFPPLHPLILAAGQLFPTDSTSGARLVNVLVSSLTTVLVFVFALQLTSSRKAAWRAGLLHAVYPSFVMYSHYLWTEPTFIFILLLGAISTVAMFEASSRTDMFLYAALGGICVGGLSLVRAAGIPLLVALPAYAIWSWHRRSGWAGLRISAVYVVAMVATLAPWQLWVRAQTNTNGAANVNQMSLYMGNNPWVHLELGAANPLESRGKVYASVQESGESPTKLALREIIAHPGTTSLRMLARFRMLISPDYWAVRHAIKVRYPPMLTFGFVVISLLFFVSFWMLGGLIIRGLVDSSVIVSHVWLPIVITLALAVGPILTVARCRYHQPMLVIMLPFAAIGVLWFWKTVPRWRAIVGGLAFCIFLTVSVSSIPVFFRWSLRPSSYYFDVLPFLPSKVANKAIFSDLITIHATGEKPIQERIGIQFQMGQGRLVSATKQQLTIELLTVNPEWPVEFTVTDRRTNESFTIRPIGKSHWQKPKATPIDGIYVAWHGAS